MQISNIVNNVMVQDNSSKPRTNDTSSKDTSFSKQLNKAVKDKEVDKSNENNATAENDDNENKTNKVEVGSDIKTSVDQNPKVLGKVEEKKEASEDKSTKTDKKTAEDGIEAILAMLNGKEPININKIVEVLKNVESIEVQSNNVQIQLKSVQNQLNDLKNNLATLSTSNSNNVNSVLQNVINLLQQVKNDSQTKDTSIKMLDEIVSDKEILKPADTKSNLDEKIKQALLLKLSNEDSKSSEAGAKKLGEVQANNYKSTATFDEKTALTANGVKETKEEKVLKGILSQDQSTDKKDTLISKVTSYAAQFNTVKDNTISVEGSKLVISKDNVVQDVIKTVNFMQVNNLKELTVKIAPKELGEVIIKLTMDNGVMKANITATNKEAFNLLNSNLSDISNKISNTEIKIQDFNLNLYNGDTTFFSDQSHKQKDNNQSNNGGRSKVSMDDEDAIDPAELDDSNVNIYA